MFKPGLENNAVGRIANFISKTAQDSEYAEDLAKKLVGNWEKWKDFGWSGQPEENSENWAIVYTANRDSGLLEQANAEAIDKIMSEFPEDQIRSESHGHWAVGHVDGYSIRVYEQDGSLTPAFQAWASIQEQLDDYPILDEELYGQKEMDAEYENIKQAIPSFLHRHEDERVEDYGDMDADELTNKFLDWGREKGLQFENIDDQGYWPSDEEMEDFVQEVVLPEIEGNESGPEPEPVDPRQMSFSGPGF